MMNPTIVQEAQKIQGWMSSGELDWLATMASTRSFIIELGSWKGRSTKALAMSTKGVVFAVDYWKRVGIVEPTLAEANTVDIFSIFEGGLREEIRTGRVVPVHSDSLVAIGPLKGLLKGRFADMIFIDCDHSYEITKRDIVNYSKLLGKGGLLCGHDYSVNWPGVPKAVDEILPGRKVVAGESIWYFEK